MIKFNFLFIFLFIFRLILAQSYIEQNEKSPTKIEKSNCGDYREVKKGSKFIIESQGFGNTPNYPNSFNCKWRFKADRDCNCQLGMTCPDFKLFNFACLDSLNVRDSNGNNRRFCSSKGPQNLFLGNETEIDFKTDLLSSSEGFRCNVFCTKDGTEDGEDEGPKMECTCGAIQNKKIVGGTETQAREFPFIAGLTRPNKNKPFCGGSLINDRYVLTAAHCTAGQSASNIDVILNEHNTATTDETFLIRRRVSKIISHPKHNNRQDYDISLLKLDYPVESEIIQGFVNPVCVAKNKTNTYEAETVTVIGWGTESEGGSQPDALQKVNVTVISNGICNLAYFGLITPRMICASGAGKDSCQGDSGGPLMHWDTEKLSWHQVGIVSFGFGCARPTSPGVYSRVTELSSFISDNTKDAKYCNNKNSL